LGLAAQLAEHLGEENLTASELDVLRHVVGGTRNRDATEEQLISEETVKVHLRHIMKKLEAADRMEAGRSPCAGGTIHLGGTPSARAGAIPRKW
jgi:DNA-binding NarL/FixJ family response regulator